MNMMAVVLMAVVLVAFQAVQGFVLYSPVDTTGSTVQYPAYQEGSLTAWTGPSSFRLDTVAMRWSLPSESTSDEALGGGITFALHKDLCTRLIDIFPEQGYEAKLFGDFFLNCEDLRNTIKRAMDTWAINHKSINFVDVTERCATVTSTDSCAAAELFIVPEDALSTTSDDLAAWVTHNLTEASVNRAPTTTAGFQIPYDISVGHPGGIGVRQAKLTLRAPASSKTFCWYLDASFCHFFHRWEAEWNFVLWGRLLCGVLFGISFVVMMWVILSIGYAVGCEPELPPALSSGASSFGAEMESASTHASTHAHMMPTTTVACYSDADGGSRLSRLQFHPEPPRDAQQADSCRSTSEQMTPRTDALVRTMSIHPSNISLRSKSLFWGNKRTTVHSQNADLACGSRRCTNLLDYLAVMPTGMLMLSLFWLIFCPAFYFRVFLPCWDCFDFESTVAHEIGHVLGFHHPDTLWELNLNANRSMASCATSDPLDASTCCFPYPLEYAPSTRRWSPASPHSTADPPSLSTPIPHRYVRLNQTQSGLSSIMFSTTTHRSTTCLSPDDLEGLNFLYPLCSGAFEVNEQMPAPLCIKAKRLSGWLRLLYISFVPFLLVSTLIFLVQLLVRRQQEKRMSSLKEAGERLRAQRAELLRKIRDKTTRNKTAVRANALVRQGTSQFLGAVNGALHSPRRSSSRYSDGMADDHADDHAGGPTAREAELERQLRQTNRQLAQIEESQLNAALDASMSAAELSRETSDGGQRSPGGRPGPPAPSMSHGTSRYSHSGNI